MYAAVSPYPNSALAAWQLALIAVVAIGGVAIWLGAVYLAAREPRARGSAAAAGAPAQDSTALSPVAAAGSPAAEPAPGPPPRAAA